MDQGILKDHRAVCTFDRGKRVTVLKRQFDPGTQTYDLLVRLVNGADTWWITEEAVERSAS